MASLTIRDLQPVGGIVASSAAATPATVPTKVNVPSESSARGDLTDGMRCPISLELMRDPVICADGHSYERANIKSWLMRSNCSPKTNLELEHKFLIPNMNLKIIIEAYRSTTRADRRSSSSTGSSAETV